MTFVLAKVFWYLSAPLNLVTLLVAMGACLSFSRWRRVGRALVVASAVILVAVAVSPLDVWVARPLENRFPPRALPDKIDGVIVLGGAVEADLSRVNGEPAIDEAAERLVAFVEILRAHPEARGVVTGGNGSLFPGDGREDEPTRAVFRSIGFDDTRVVYENESRDTWENAVFSRRLVEPRSGETWVLVTSAAHMPRAMGIFRRVGWVVIPRSVDRRVPKNSDYRRALGDVSANWRRLSDAIREWVGLVAYRLFDRTDAFFPAPRPDAP